MSQTIVTKFYPSRKRFKDPVNSVKSVENQKLSETLLQEEKAVKTKTAPRKSKVVKAKQPKQAESKSKQTNKVSKYLKSDPDKKKVSEKNEKTILEDKAKKLNLEILPENEPELPRTPKRNLSNPDESTPTKKKVFQEDSATPSTSEKPLNSTFTICTSEVEVGSARRKLILSSPQTNKFGSPRKTASPVKNTISPQKAASYGNLNAKDVSSLLNESRSKILFSNRLDELKISLEKFSKLSSKVKDFQSNSCKITSVISSAKPSDTQPKPVIQSESAFKKYSYLASTESLVLPHKYKVLGEIFRCTDTVTSMLNNRKEKITFEKLQSGVQKMMNRNFQKSHLGQILTIFPEAFSLEFEKNTSYTMNKNRSSYELVITPCLHDINGNAVQSEEPDQKERTSYFTQMTPQILLDRKHTFNKNLTNRVKQHHKEFLAKIKFPVVDDDAILRWHPKFNVEGVPDVPAAPLPEEPESKVHTAKDVLNKIKGKVRGRVEEALKSVADEHTPTNKSSSVIESQNNSVNKKQSSALKGICTDLLEKIRARETAKLVETMTRSVHDEKRKAMIERLPKIVHIIWHYFIAERKSAVSVDAAIDKIIHSCNSLATPETVKEHLQLITEVMPGWLSFIKIPKGEYITMNKTKDINEMIANLK